VEEGSLGGKKGASNHPISGKALMSLHKVSKDKSNKMKTHGYSIERNKYLTIFREIFAVYATHMYTVQLENVGCFLL